MIIKLEKIFNARDLGGMKGADGKTIKPKRLIRSSCLFGSSPNDVKTLKEDFNLINIIDFRYESEREEKPHPSIDYRDVNYYSFPCFMSIKKAFTRDKESLKFIQNLGKEFSEEEAIRFIEAFYK